MSARLDDMIEFECELCGAYVVIYDPYHITATQEPEYFHFCADCRGIHNRSLPQQVLVIPLCVEN